MAGAHRAWANPRALARPLASFLGVVVASSLVFGAMVWHVPGSPQKLGGHSEDGTSFVLWLLSFWRGVFTLDLGPSYRGIPIETLVLQGAARSLPLIAGALVLSVCGSLAIVVFSGHRRTRLNRVSRGIVHGVSLVPVFLLAYLAIIFLAVPPDGPWLLLAAIIILALGDGMITDVLLGLDAEVELLLDRDFIHSAQLRGVPIWSSLGRHLAVPMSQIVAAKMAYLVGGVLIIEKVLGIQGIGWIGYRAATRQDFLLLVTITVAVTALVAAAHLVVDLVRFLVDPRTSHRESRLPVRPRSNSS